MAHNVYVDDNSNVPAGVRVYENRFGLLEDGDGRAVTRVKDDADVSGNSPFGNLETSGEFTKVDLKDDLRDLIQRIAVKVGA